MREQNLIHLATNYMDSSIDNYVSEEDAISDISVGVKLFESPLFAFASAQDVCFTRLKDPVAIGSHFKLPTEWLPSANTVMSFFLPFTDIVKQGNSRNMKWPSEEWLHGRFEGQMILNKLCKYLQGTLQKAGYESVVPSLEEGFWSRGKANPDDHRVGETHPPSSYTSNWSERHVAFVCGLGTFGLSKGLITTKGTAGRFGSIVTALKLNPTPREYEVFDAYCAKCGACIGQCPVRAISFERGKDRQICSDFLAVTRRKFTPRYGCGKCQVNVPCESRVPGR